MTVAVTVVNINGVTTVYLSQGDISLLLGRERTMVNVWRSRFDDFPEPDGRTGMVKAVPGWNPDRMPEIVQWCIDHGFEIRPQAVVMAEIVNWFRDQGFDTRPGQAREA